MQNILHDDNSLLLKRLYFQMSCLLRIILTEIIFVSVPLILLTASILNYQLHY